MEKGSEVLKASEKPYPSVIMLNLFSLKDEKKEAGNSGNKPSRKQTAAQIRITKGNLQYYLIL